MTKSEAVVPLGTDVWSRYWRLGHAHSCPTSFSGYYGDVTQQFWLRQVGALGADSQLLELGCGNGGLFSFLAGALSPGDLPQLLGVDAASLDPACSALSAVATHARSRVVLLPNVRFSSLPVADGSVHAIVSQFAFEYGADEDAWSEVFRVAAPKARVAMIVHMRGSLLETVARDEILIAQRWQECVYARAKQMAAYVVLAQTGAGRKSLSTNLEANAVRQDYNAATSSLLGLGQALTHGAYAEDLLRQTTIELTQPIPATTSRILERLEVLRQGVEDHVGRLRALRECALSQDGVNRFVSRFSSKGFSMRAPVPLIENRVELGWMIEGNRGIN